ncbi:16S rRNA (cytosine(1402)-N(4))-methyltransferase RsmH [Candidatus Woesebacteria bacterium]|nr:MAG: 16S rRNA (cytosine(1402)-N(4))-methyltransferase RsmH [Candidatus Woesebacteria bacterium]
MNKTQTEMQKIHEPVMVGEVIKILEENALLNNQSKTILVDATLGLGGHARELVRRNVFVVGFDKDKEFIEVAEKELEKACPTQKSTSECFKLINDDFIHLKKRLDEIGIKKVDAVLFDLGINTLQLMSESRGFSFRNGDALLDMRFDRDRQNVTAADVINGLRKDQLMHMLLVTMEFREANKIASKICTFRNRKSFKTVGDVLELVPSKAYSQIHPATKLFLALRIAVNSEIENLIQALEAAFDVLNIGGTLIVISFHSGEDAVVKKFFFDLKKANKASGNKKPILPSTEEVRQNNKARSAKLRYVIKTNE